MRYIFKNVQGRPNDVNLPVVRPLLALLWCVRHDHYASTTSALSDASLVKAKSAETTRGLIKGRYEFAGLQPNTVNSRHKVANNRSGDSTGFLRPLFDGPR